MKMIDGTGGHPLIGIVPGADRCRRPATAGDDSRPAALRYVLDGTSAFQALSLFQLRPQPFPVFARYLRLRRHQRARLEQP
ncbi:hypothetical protein DMB66_01855 [Actinoplanes sp. ATCC 53533]|nr:hypothetical protein DMB66_01855 [Actinoplanes sp. ATCC 53533]